VSVAALSGDNRTNEILLFCPKRYDYLIFVHISNALADIWSSYPFSTACSKIARNVGPLCEHRHGDAFSIHWQQFR